MTLQHLLLGKFTLEQIPYTNPIIMGAASFMVLIVLAAIIPMTYYNKWGYIWREWITTVDHKKIGIMYLILALLMLIRGFSDALLMRSQQAIAVGHSMGYLPSYHYQEIFTAHGVIMIFFVAMPLIFGLVNLTLPLQIGARDVAYPFLNSFSFWMTAAGMILVNLSLVIGKFAQTGWLAYPPLSELAYSPGVGVDYYIWALQIAGVGSLLSGINFIVTILKMRCPGMKMMRMPMFCWATFAAMILVVLAFPILTATLGMLCLDRYLGMHFFTAGYGGNAMMYINLIWAWGHPEVYILILPIFGVFSEVVATFSKKKLFGYVTMVWAIMIITFLSFVVWLHHFFTMGAGANVNAFFGITTMIIAIPTGVKIFNWLFTMYRGRVHFTMPMLWTLAFISTFAVGGMTGVLMSVPVIDFQMHNSVFLVAHFHNVIIGGVVFGSFAAVSYWWPKTFGFHLNETWSKRSFFFWVIGFYVAFMPLYVLGLKGMTRRLSHYSAATGWHPWLVCAAVGAGLILIGVFCQLVDFYVSIRDRNKYPAVGDPWDGRTLEWSIPSPAPFYNFAVTPVVKGRDAFWAEKQNSILNQKTHVEYKDIHMPANTSVGFLLAIFSGILGFGMIWHIWWLGIFAFIAIIITLIVRSLDMHTDYFIKAHDVKKMDQALQEREQKLRVQVGLAKKEVSL